MMENNSEHECPECGSTTFNKSGRETFCKDCGVVVDEHKIEDQEYRAFTKEEKEKRSRVGGKITYKKPDRGLKTKIGRSRELYKVNGGKKKGQYYRLRKWQNRLTNNSQQRRKRLLNVLELKISELGLPDNVYEDSARLAAKAQDEEMVQGRKTEDVVAACIFISCKNHEIPRSLQEVSEVCENSKRRIAEAYRAIAREFGLRIVPSDPKHFVPRYANQLSLDSDAKRIVYNLIDRGNEKDLFIGKGPRGVVAASLYLASKMQSGQRAFTQQEVAEVVGVSDVTVRNMKQLMREELQIEVEVAA